MIQTKSRSAGRRNLALGFAFPCFGMLFVMLISRFEPFGNYSMLYSDMYHQYYPFFVEFRRALLEGKGLLYTWSVGLGMDYLGLIAYYLASPLNLLSVLVPESWLLEYFSLLVPIKLGFAGLFFAIFLQKIFQREDISTAIFGGLYGLCAWALGFQWNVMWLDTFALLPLVALGAVKLLAERKFLLYTLSLFFSVFINYYVGLFTCIFIFLLFFVYELCRWGGWKKFFGDLFRIAFFSALALGMTAILALPTLTALQTTQSSVNKFPTGFRLNIASSHDIWGLLDAMRKVAGNMGGALEPNFKEGLPNVYCGIFSVVLMLLYLMAGGVRLRDKLCAVALLLFFNVSFIIRQLDYIWHGFHFTNMIPYRFSFLYSFVVLYMAYRAWVKREEFQVWQIILAGALAAGVLACSDALTETEKLELGTLSFQFPVYFAYNLLFLLLYLTAMLSGRVGAPKPERDAGEEQTGEEPAAEKEGTELTAEKEQTEFTAEKEQTELTAEKEQIELTAEKEQTEPTAEEEQPSGALAAAQAITEQERARAEWVYARQRRRSSALLLLIMALEMMANLICFGLYFTGTGVSNYPKGKEKTASVIRYMFERERNNLFFRAETTHSQTLNDGALNGYNGVSAFTSSANVKTTLFMQTLGYGAKNTYNRYLFEESSPVSNLFLNLKYMIERDGKDKESRYFKNVNEFGSSILLENQAWLPLGFLTESTLADLPFDRNINAFRFQNNLLSSATGIQENVWQRLEGELLTITPNAVTLESQSSDGYCKYKDAKSGSDVTYTYLVPQDGFACIHLDLPKRNDYYVSINGEEKFKESISLPQMMAVGDVHAGDTISVRVVCKSGESSTMTVSAAVLDPDCFERCYEKLRASTLELTKFESTRVEGTIQCDRDGLLYTSIPQNGNWKALVDGEESETRLVGECMIGVPLSQGSHQVTLVYENAALSLGWKISLACAVVLLALAWGKRKAEKR